MAYRVARAGGCIVEVPIQFAERARGMSNMSVRIVIEALVRVTWCGVRDRAAGPRAAVTPAPARLRPGVTPTGLDPDRGSAPDTGRGRTSRATVVSVPEDPV